MILTRLITLQLSPRMKTISSYFIALFLTAPFLAALSLVTLGFSSSTLAANKTLISPVHRPNMLELYTSQGCSSCPPAERWINTFSQRYIEQPKLWQQTIPINFHVDYWDYIGWKDPFARPAFSQRQRDYSKFKHSRNVATPGFMVDGKGWNGWFWKRTVPITAVKAPGIITANIDDDTATIVFKSANSLQDLKLNIALLGFDQSTSIRRGENRGRELKHDFVVIAYQQQNFKQGPEPTKTKLPSTGRFTSERQAIVVWLSQGQDPSPIQAVAGWL